MGVVEQLVLFELPEGAIVARPGLSAGRRRTMRQLAMLTAGRHPFGGRVHPEAAPVDDRSAPGRRCGNCSHRVLVNGGQRDFPKCLLGATAGGDAPRLTHGAATDVRAWWPACTDHVKRVDG